MSDYMTVAILKPDAVRRGLVGHILNRAAEERLFPADLRMEIMTPSLARRFYAGHEGRPYFVDLIDFMCRGPSVFVLFELDSPVGLGMEEGDAITVWRRLLGSTNPQVAKRGTLRRAYGTEGPANVGHGSDSPEAVERERAILGLRCSP